MTDRITRMKERISDVRTYPICTEKYDIMLNAYEKNAGYPVIYQRAIAQAEYLDKKTIFIDDDELIVGNEAAVPFGLEATPNSPTWPDEDLDILIKTGAISMSDESRKALRKYDYYWESAGRTRDEKTGFFYENDRMWKFVSRGFLCPPWKSTKIGWGRGAAGQGGWSYGLGMGLLWCPDFERHVFTGCNEMIRQCREELENLHYKSVDDLEKFTFLRSAIIVLEAFVRCCERYGDLAEKMAAECKDEKRKAELLQIAETCRWVPANPPRNFREAVQSFYFHWCMCIVGTTPGGRFDQYMGPIYEADKKAGRITYEEGLELLECLRLKIASSHALFGGAAQREKWAGAARWHNFIIGGTDKDGKDITNDVTYLLLDAAYETQTPQHTLSLRVHEGTPPELMRKAMKLVRTGLGMPAFLSERSYKNFMMKYGMTEEEASRFVCAGCLDIEVPGSSITTTIGMFITPCVLELAVFGGKFHNDDEQLGPVTGCLGSFSDYDSFYEAFLKQLKWCMNMVGEEHLPIQYAQQQAYPDVFQSVYSEDGIKAGKDVQKRCFKFDNSSLLNMVGIINVVNSLASIKKLVFEDKVCDGATMMAALRANWEGYEDLRKACQDAPKYGNNDDYVDSIASSVFKNYAEFTKDIPNIHGHPIMPSGISITAHAPSGAYMGASPDGRKAGEAFADGSTSPVQGTDENGPTAVFQSAMKLSQDDFSAMLLNMKFHKSALKTDEDLDKLGSMVKTYLTNGGKQVQFNVADAEVLKAAKKDKETYKNLVVRVAGYSSYFVVLTPQVQDEIIARTAHDL